MRYLYAGLLATGFLLLLVWTIARALGARTTARGVPPGIAGAIGFGLGGLSAAFAGWPVVAHVPAAVVAGAAAMAWVRLSRVGGAP